jgi:hypothetical protein
MILNLSNCPGLQVFLELRSADDEASTIGKGSLPVSLDASPARVAEMSEVEV